MLPTLILLSAPLPAPMLPPLQPAALEPLPLEQPLSLEQPLAAPAELGALSSLRGLASAADDEFPTPPAASAPTARPVESDNDTLSHYEKLFLVLKHYLRGRGYATALRALSFARSYHVGKRRDGVTPEFEHQLSIALYLTTLKDVMDEEKAVTCALLHDVMEDYDVGIEEIEARFGSDVARTVWLLTKTHRGVKKDPDTYFAEIADDPIASLVKGADRIHNVQSMVGVFSIEKQKAYIEEVETYFMPMLKRAGYNFPEQTAAYYNIRQMLKSQLQLLKAHHRAVEGK
jgi:(p)ppGpp synthase/HD superfamily hydrolase